MNIDISFSSCCSSICCFFSIRALNSSHLISCISSLLLASSSSLLNFDKMSSFSLLFKLHVNMILSNSTIYQNSKLHHHNVQLSWLETLLMGITILQWTLPLLLLMYNSFVAQMPTVLYSEVSK